jgi:Flp pilus assembly protein TadB
VVVLLILLCAALASFVTPGPQHKWRGIALSAREDVRPEPAASPRSWIEDARFRAVLCATGCALLAAVIFGPWWFVGGCTAGFGLSVFLGRVEPASVARSREQLARDLPLAVELLAACARAGQPVEQSLVVVSRAVGGPLARRLSQLEARLRLGSDPISEWRRLGHDPQLAPLARTIVRSLDSGAPLADGLARLASDRRLDQRMRSQQRARSVGVKSAAPLAGCFLPAFMLIGVIPTVAGAFLQFVL